MSVKLVSDRFEDISVTARVVLLFVLLSACTVEKIAILDKPFDHVSGAIQNDINGSSQFKPKGMALEPDGLAHCTGSGPQQDHLVLGGPKLKKPALGQPIFYDQSKSRNYFIDDETGESRWYNGELGTICI